MREPMAQNTKRKAKASPAARSDPVDRSHLSSMTLDDPALAREVLSLFVSQSQIYLAAFCRATNQQARHEAAHALKGAARGIGAWALGELAGEACQTDAVSAEALGAEVERVCGHIDELVGGVR